MRALTHELFESPVDIPDWDFDLTDVTFSTKRLKELLALPACKVIGTFEGLPVYGTRDYVFVGQAGRLAYLAKVASAQFPGARGRYVTQVALWRDGLFGAQGLTRYVFWELLLPRHGAIMTDNSQTADGRQFWRRRVGEALTKAVHVYLVDLAGPTATAVKSPTDYERACQQAYGTADRHRQLRLLITQAPLTAMPVVPVRRVVLPPG